MSAPRETLTPAEVRRLRLREDARRPASVNLAETIALSHALIRLAEAGRRSDAAGV